MYGVCACSLSFIPSSISSFTQPAIIRRVPTPHRPSGPAQGFFLLTQAFPATAACSGVRLDCYRCWSWSHTSGLLVDVWMCSTRHKLDLRWFRAVFQQRVHAKQTVTWLMYLQMEVSHAAGFVTNPEGKRSSGWLYKQMLNKVTTATLKLAVWYRKHCGYNAIILL